MNRKALYTVKATAVAAAAVYGILTLKEQFKEKVQPKRGSVLKVDLAGVVEHSGIYLGSGRIAELNGRGEVKAVGFEEFTNHLTGITVYCACDEQGAPLAQEIWWQRAQQLSLISKFFE